jgi:hypothetical protein
MMMMMKVMMTYNHSNIREIFPVLHILPKIKHQSSLNAQKMHNVPHMPGLHTSDKRIKLRRGI